MIFSILQFSNLNSYRNCETFLEFIFASGAQFSVGNTVVKRKVIEFFKKENKVELAKMCKGMENYGDHHIWSYLGED